MKHVRHIPKPFQSLDSYERDLILTRMRLAVRRALRDGIFQEMPCELCGSQKITVACNGVKRRATVAHHDDYNRPLHVRWLCQLHHNVWHGKNKPLPMEDRLMNYSTSQFYALGLHQLLDDPSPMIGRRREAVWAYANGKRKVPGPVEKLMRLLAASESE
jgi:hypothetical protein